MGAVVQLAEVQAPVSRSEFVERIHGAWHKSRGEIFAIGNTLCEARQRLPHGEFIAMVENDLPFGPRQAQLFMRLAVSPQVAKANHDAGLPNDWNAMVLIDRLKDEELEAGIARGVIREGVSRAEIVQFRKDLRKEHPHRTGETTSLAPPSRPEGAGAQTAAEVIWLWIAARKAAGFSQEAVDDAAWRGESRVCSKYEIPHDKINGRVPSLKALCEMCQAIGYVIKLVPASG